MALFTNRDRANFAKAAIEAYRLKSYSADDALTRAQDLIGDIIHFVRLEGGMSFDEAVKVVHSAIEMSRTEMEDDRDE